MIQTYVEIPFLVVAEQIVDLLMEEDTSLKSAKEKEKEFSRLRFEIGKKLFELKESQIRKNKNMYKIIAEEIVRQLPKEKRISPTDLHNMMLFYKSSEALKKRL